MRRSNIVTENWERMTPWQQWEIYFLVLWLARPRWVNAALVGITIIIPETIMHDLFLGAMEGIVTFLLILIFFPKR